MYSKESLYSQHKDGVIPKLCRQDIIDRRTVPKIKVCPKQKVIYKLSKSQTLRKKLKHQKSKRWKLQKIDATNWKSIKIASWTRINKKMKVNPSFLNVSKQSIDYRFIDNNNNNNELLKKRYVEIGLSSMEWTRHETDLLLTLCNNFDNRWSVIIDRYNCCKPSFRPKRNMIEIKQRYYECRALIISFQDKMDKNNNNNNKYKYDASREKKRRNELKKLLMRSHDENIEISQTAQYYRKHNKLLRKKVNEMNKKRLQLRSYGAFICDRQQMQSTEIQENNNMNNMNNMNNINNIHLSLPFGQYQGFGVVLQDDLLKKNGNNICNQNIYKQLPSNCIPKKYAKIRRNIQMIDDEYTKYKYELKLDAQNKTIIPFPYCDKSMIQNNNDKNKNNKNTEIEIDEEQEMKLLNSRNPNLGKDIAKIVQNELIKEKIITINKINGMPLIEPITNITRSMVNALREDFITYYALKTMINDKKKEMLI